MGEKLFVLLDAAQRWFVCYESELPEWAKIEFKEFIESDAPDSFLGRVAKSKEAFLVRISPDSARAAGLKS